MMKFFRAHHETIAVWCGVVLSFGFIVLFVVLALKRAGYPYEVEWMEGAFIRHAARIFHGEQLYVKPTIDFVNFLYPPLAYYAFAAVMPWTGVTCTAGRVITMSSTVLTMLIIFFVVLRLTDRSYKNALIGAGLFIACYGLTDMCFDIVRPDPMFVTLLVASVAVLIVGQRPLHIILSAILITLAYFTKFQAIYYVLPVALWLWLQARSLAVTYIIVILVCFCIGTYCFSTANGEWYWYYLYTVPRGKSSSIGVQRMIYLFPNFLLSGWAVATIALTGGYAILARNRKNFFRSLHGFLALCLMTSAVHIAIHLMDPISGRNSAIPFAAFVAIALPYVLREAGPLIVISYRSILPWFLVFQLLASIYNPTRMGFAIVRAADRKAGDDFVDTIRSMKGNVLLWNNSIAVDLAGKRPFANELAVDDVLSVDDSTAHGLRAEIISALNRKIFDEIIVDDATLNRYDSIPGYTFSSMINRGANAYHTYYMAFAAYPRYVLVPQP